MGRALEIARNTCGTSLAKGRRPRRIPMNVPRTWWLMALGLAACAPVPEEAPVAAQRALTAGASGQIVATQPVGRVPGQMTVSADGSANYAIPIEVPSGRAGVQPELALRYNSRAGNGPLGVGWALQGASGAISRCDKTLGRDGTIAGVKLDSTDNFCFDGNKLVKVAGASYGADASEYRTDHDSFSKIVISGADAAGPISFKVWSKDGRIYTYGNTADSRLEAWRYSAVTNTGPTTPVFARLGWMLNRVEDRAGNYLTVTYGNTKPTAVGVPLETWVQRIDYTGSASLAPNRSVQLTYETRDDPSTAWMAGVQMVTTIRLVSINTYGPAQAGGAVAKLRGYQLAYRKSASTGRSRLDTVTLCDGAQPAVCLPPTQLGYSEATHSFTTSTFAGTAWNHSFITDVDGDGLDDLIYTDATDHVFVQKLSPLGSPVSAGIQAANPQVYDINRDGRVDLLDEQKQADGTYVPQTYAYVSGNFYPLGWNPVSSGFSTYAGGHLLDLGGDMLPDWLYPDSTANAAFPKGTGVGWSWVQQNNSTLQGWNSPYRIYGRGGKYSLGVPDQFVDLDGDGAIDVLTVSPFVSGNAAYYDIYQSSGVKATSLVKDSCNLFVDANGDGLPELVNFNGGLTMRTNMGALQFAPAVNAVAPGASFGGLACVGLDSLYGVVPVDYDQDGRQDVLVMGLDGRDVMLLRSNGTSFTPIDLGITLTDSGDLASTNAKDALVGDVNGDGLFDILHLDRNSNTVSLYTQNTAFADLLTNVSEPMGVMRQVDYQPMIAGSNGGLYPKRGYTGSILVVKNEWMSLGNGVPTGPSSLMLIGVHAYGGAEVDSRGDGFLGFAWTSVTDPLTTTVVKTTYDQTRMLLDGVYRYPFKGQPTEVLTYLQTDGIWHATRTLTQYSAVETNNKLTWFSYPSSVDTRTYESTATFDPGNEGVAFSSSGNPNLMRVTVTTSAVDAYGNATSIVELKGPSETYAPATHYRTTTTHSFSNDTTNWLLGRATSEVTLNESPNGNATRTTNAGYDGNGNLVQTVREPGDTGALYLRTTITRDAMGMPTASASCSYSNSCRSATIGYDADDLHIASKTNALGFTSTTTWHAGLDATLAESDVNSLSATFDHDGFGRLRKVTRPDGTFTTYDSVDCRMYGYSTCDTTTNSDGSVFKVTRDQLGRHDWDGALTLDGTMTYVERIFNGLGNVVEQFRPSFWNGAPLYVDKYVDYDALGRPLFTHQNNLNLYQEDYYYQHLVWHYDENWIEDITAYDSAGHVQATSHGGNVSTYQYGPFDTLVGITDANGNTVALSYDRLGRRTKTVDRDIGSVTVSYDAFGEPLTSTDAKGQVTTMTYDALGRPLTRTAPDGTDTWTYDPPGAKGQLATRTRGTTSTTYTYDPLTTRPTRESWTIDGVIYNYDMTYDSQGRPLQMAYPNAPGRPRFTVDRVYNAFGFLTQVRDVSVPSAPVVLWTAQQMDSEGHLTKELLGNGLTTTRTYAPDTGLLQRDTTGAIYDLEYAYQANGDISSRTDHLNSPTAAQVAHTESFTYDGSNRLASSTVQGRATATYAYTYDALGNLTGAGDSPCSGYTYGEGTAGPHALTSLTCNGVHLQNAYDADGNELVANRPATLQTVWTSFNKPSTVQSPEGMMQYFYDADHVRVKKVKATGPSSAPSGVWSTTIFAGAGYEKRIGATTDHVYTVSAGGRAIAEMIWREQANLAEWRYLHSDPQGSVSRTTDAVGSLKESTSSDVWGVRRNADWTVMGAPTLPPDTRVGFTGQQYDDELGVIDMHGRSYDPLFKRFTSADSLIPNPSYGPALNRYAYVYDNPLLFTDPSGHQPINQYFAAQAGMIAKGGFADGDFFGGMGSAGGVTSSLDAVMTPDGRLVIAVSGPPPMSENSLDFLASLAVPEDSMDFLESLAEDGMDSGGGSTILGQKSYLSFDPVQPPAASLALAAAAAQDAATSSDQPQLADTENPFEVMGNLVKQGVKSAYEAYWTAYLTDVNDPTNKPRFENYRYALNDVMNPGAGPPDGFWSDFSNFLVGLGDGVTLGVYTRDSRRMASIDKSGDWYSIGGFVSNACPPFPFLWGFLSTLDHD
jgi:RHS repeat-associated protein